MLLVTAIYAAGVSRLQEDPPPESYRFAGETRVRFIVEGDTDEIWRRLYNDRAKALTPSLPAVAMGHGVTTMILISLPENLPFDSASEELFRAEDLIVAIDDERQAEADRERSARGLAGAWLGRRNADPQRFPRRL